VASLIKVEAFVKMFGETLYFVEQFLPVSVEELASPLGRVAFSYEEFATVVIMAMWCIARGSDCLAGRVGAGTMEMLLAQPLRRLSVVVSHTAVTLAGVAAIALAAWAGVALGLTLSAFDEPPAWSKFGPATFSYVGLGVFITGAATLTSALARTRAQAVGIVVGVYVVEIIFMIVGRTSQRFGWLSWLSILTAYEPTMLTLRLEGGSDAAWTMYGQYNGCLFGLGALLLALAAAIFCRRDVPAPL
jgi:ABC-type transport system involved in multi-copper enzyme maturation permease subunit